LKQPFDLAATELMAGVGGVAPSGRIGRGGRGLRGRVDGEACTEARAAGLAGLPGLAGDLGCIGNCARSTSLDAIGNHSSGSERSLRLAAKSICGTKALMDYMDSFVQESTDTL